MQEIQVTISDKTINQKMAQQIGQILAERVNPETIVVARYNRQTNACSPCSLKGDIGSKPGWEVYGENHGGRLKISVNDGEFIFIFS